MNSFSSPDTPRTPDAEGTGDRPVPAQKKQGIENMVKASASHQHTIKEHTAAEEKERSSVLATLDESLTALQNPDRQNILKQLSASARTFLTSEHAGGVGSMSQEFRNSILDTLSALNPQQLSQVDIRQRAISVGNTDWFYITVRTGTTTIDREFSLRRPDVSSFRSDRNRVNQALEKHEKAFSEGARNAFQEACQGLVKTLLNRPA